MTTPVALALPGVSWEADLVAALERCDQVRLVRRCVELAEVLALAQTGQVRAALLGAGLRGLDREAVARLRASRVAVVGLVGQVGQGQAGVGSAQDRLRALGVDRHVTVEADLAASVAEIIRAVQACAQDPAGAVAWSDPAHALEDTDSGTGAGFTAPSGGLGGAADLVPGPPAEVGAARLVAVWGPAGAPGRSTVAVNVAGEAARAGVSTLLADADVYGGSVATMLGLLDESAGLAAATRLAGSGSLDAAGLARLAPAVTSGLRVLTGLSRPQRWPELRPAALTVVWQRCRELAALTVVDCGFSLERDEELSFDTLAPRRNGATLATLTEADEVLALCRADPVGVARFVRALPELRELRGDRPLRVVLTAVRSAVVGSGPQRQLREALVRYAGVSDTLALPDDRPACDRAMREGRLLHEVAPRSGLRQAIAGLARDVAGLPTPARRLRRA